MIPRIILTTVCPLLFAAAARADDRRADLEQFEKHVRPILVQNCYRCHSKDAKRLKGGLRLDSRSLMLKGGDTGKVIVPGHPEKSLLIKAIGYADPDLRMPPRSKLPQEQIDAIAQWIKDGAVTPDDKGVATTIEAFDLEKRRREHWAFQPLRVIPPPSVKNPEWARNAIDRFILSGLESNRLSPAPSASRRTLIRRATYDLIGLPPTPEEVEAFLNDESPDAFAKVVDRLLASPQYGERWARHWLDLVRYAETQGHEFDFDLPYAFEYRDYVIRALNKDVSYKQFVTEHVAGDLLKQSRRDPITRINESIIGTGFFFLGEGKHSPVDIRGEGANRTDNQIDVFSKTFLALTIGCARCHDHKFDAISQKDYYALSGYVRSSRFHRADINPIEPTSKVLSELRRVQDEQQSLAIQVTADSLLSALDGFAKKLTADPTDKFRDELLQPWNALRKSNSFDADRKALVRRWQDEERTAFTERIFKDFRKTGLKDWFVTGPALGSAATRATDVIVDAKQPRPVRGLRGPGLAHSGRYGSRLQGTLRSPSFTINCKKIHYLLGGKGAKVRLIIDGFQVIRAPIYGGIEFGVNSGEQLQWRSMDVSMWIGHRAYVELLDEGDGYFILSRVAFSDGAPPRDEVSSALLEVLDDDKIDSADKLARKYEATLIEVLGQWKNGKLHDPAKADVLAQLMASPLLGNDTPISAATRTKLASLQHRLKQLENLIPAPRRVMALVDGTGENERLFIRGNHKNPGPEVPRRFYEAVAGKDQPESAYGSGRLQLAKRMVSANNPLLPRVLVNRLWRHHFGRGIVATPDDFGKQGQRPTHPELLDWLANDFVSDGWSINRMHRKMVLSSTYRMSSRGNSEADELDPQNKLVHRMPIRRLEAEAIRDAVLAVSGRLDKRMHGRGVMPHLTEHMTGRGRPGRSGPLDGDGRRSIYVNVRRNFLTPFFLAFDYPTPFMTRGRRSVSSVPAQALAMMNNPFVRQQAEIWAKRILAEGGKSAAERIERLYLEAFGRPPTKTELEAALSFVQGKAAGDEVRAWTELCHVLFNVKEFIFVN